MRSPPYLIAMAQFVPDQVLAERRALVQILVPQTLSALDCAVTVFEGMAEAGTYDTEEASNAAGDVVRVMVSARWPRATVC